MAQNFLTPSIITRETLLMLENQSVFFNLVNKKFINYFHGIGSTLTVRKPNKFVVKTGPQLQVQEINEPSVTITVDQQIQVAYKWSSADYALTLEEVRERYVMPAVSPMANQLDLSIAQLYTGINNVVGTAGTTPTTYATSVALTGQRLDENAAPQDGRSLVLNPAGYWGIVGGQSNAFVTRVSEKALIKGYIAEVGNQSIYMDQNIQRGSAATYGGTPLSNAATAQTGASIITDGWTATTTTLPVGTVISFGGPSGDTGGGVYAVNPQNYQSTGNLMQFTVTAATATDGSGNSTIAISPAIVTSGPFQNVSNGVKNNSPITVYTGLTTATAINNLAFCKDAFGLIVVPMPLPDGVHRAARVSHKGLSMRMISDYDPQNDVFYTRLDMLYGVAVYYPELAVRLLG